MRCCKARDLPTRTAGISDRRRPNINQRDGSEQCIYSAVGRARLSENCTQHFPPGCPCGFPFVCQFEGTGSMAGAVLYFVLTRPPGHTTKMRVDRYVTVVTCTCMRSHKPRMPLRHSGSKKIFQWNEYLSPIVSAFPLLLIRLFFYTLLVTPYATAIELLDAAPFTTLCGLKGREGAYTQAHRHRPSNAYSGVIGPVH